MKPLAQEIGSRLRARRKQLKLTQQELTAKSGIDPATISRIEKGRMIGALTAHKALAEALKMTLSELYQGL